MGVALIEDLSINYTKRRITNSEANQRHLEDASIAGQSYNFIHVYTVCKIISVISC